MPIFLPTNIRTDLSETPKRDRENIIFFSDPGIFPIRVPVISIKIQTFFFEIVLNLHKACPRKRLKIKVRNRSMTSKIILNVDAVTEIKFLNAKGEFRVCVRNKARVYFVTSVMFTQIRHGVGHT